MSEAANPLLLPDSGEVLDLDQVRIDPSWALRIPASLALRKRVLPICRLGNKVVVACATSDDQPTLKNVARLVEMELSPCEAEPESLRRALMRIYGGASIPGSVDAGPARFRTRGERGSEVEDAVAVCDELLQAAALREASDIHLVPTENRLHAKFRVDGQLEIYRELPMDLHGAVLSRFKVMAGLDIAEKRAPQDGRFTTRVGPGQTKLDIRTATLPTRFGERITLRLLAGHTSSLSLSSLGMNQDDLDVFQGAIHRPHGLVLLTGPTGSGKSTTLYASIQELLRSRGGNVITVEDPIEYEMPGVSQVEVDSADKVNFSKALRSILRHDPDIVMIGEIRDHETAGIAMKAALTGHLVLSTLHTNTAAGVVTRLIDMGMERFLVAATLRLSVAQRLVRKLCPHCRLARPLSAREAIAFGDPQLEGETVYDPRGCVYCAGRGYSGRVALFEMIPCSETMAGVIAAGAGEDAVAKVARDESRPQLIDDALLKLRQGVTSVNEVLANVIQW